MENPLNFDGIYQEKWWDFPWHFVSLPEGTPNHERFSPPLSEWSKVHMAAKHVSFVGGKVIPVGLHTVTRYMFPFVGSCLGGCLFTFT